MSLAASLVRRRAIRALRTQFSRGQRADRGDFSRAATGRDLAHLSAMKTKTFKRQDRRSPDLGNAFVPDVARTHKRLADDCAEAFAEEFIVSATSADAIAEVARDEWLDEEIGGPFLEVRTIEEMDLTSRELRDWQTQRGRAVGHAN